MSGDPPEPDEAELFVDKWTDYWEGRTYLFLLLAPGVLGAGLVIDGVASASWLEAGIGALLLASTPFVARWVPGKTETGPE